MTANQITKKLSKVLTVDEMTRVQTYKDGAAIWPIGDEDLDDVLEIACKAAKVIKFGVIDNGFKFMLVESVDAHFDSLDKAMTY